MKIFKLIYKPVIFFIILLLSWVTLCFFMNKDSNYINQVKKYNLKEQVR